MAIKEKMSPQQRIKASLEDMDMFVRLCYGDKLANEVDFLSEYLEDRHKKNIITDKEYVDNRASIKDKIRKFGEDCECNIKNLPPGRITYVGPK